MTTDVKNINEETSDRETSDHVQVLSDTPEHRSGVGDGSLQNGATLNTNAKSNLTAKETNQVSELVELLTFFSNAALSLFFSFSFFFLPSVSAKIIFFN